MRMPHWAAQLSCTLRLGAAYLRFMANWIVAALLATLAFANVTGTWTGTLAPEGRDSGPAHLVLKQDGDTVTGTAGATEQGERLTIRNGIAKDGVVTFEVETPGGHLMKFDLREQGDELTGTVTRERDGETARATLSVKRVTR